MERSPCQFQGAAARWPLTKKRQLHLLTKIEFEEKQLLEGNDGRLGINLISTRQQNNKIKKEFLRSHLQVCHLKNTLVDHHKKKIHLVQQLPLEIVPAKDR